MTARDNFDRPSFQSLLANAYSVQQSGMSPQSLASIIEIQSTISNDGIDASSALNLIADRAQAVSSASGIGIALLEGNKLVHRAGNGTASQIVGSQLTAVLGASSPHPRREILRVENAETDSRIEADICRQFDAQALLMVPIYREGKMIGVIEVLFNEPHQFAEPEVRTYQLMSTLAGDASLLPVETPQQVTPSTVPHALWRIGELQPFSLGAEPQPRRVQSAEDSPFVRALTSIRRGSQQWARPRFDFTRFRVLMIGYMQRQAESLAHVRSRAEDLRNWACRTTIWSGFVGHARDLNIQRVLDWRPAVSRKFQWNALAISLVIALAIAAAITRHDSRAVRVSDPPGQPETTAVSSQAAPAGDLGPVSDARARAVVPLQAGVPNSAFKRLRVGKNEVDYVADDVTIREFRSAPSQADARASAKQVNIGKDVTVRYFDSKPIPPRESAVSTTDQALKD